MTSLSRDKHFQIALLSTELSAPKTMASTANSALVQFQRESIDLDPEITSKARASRNWLRDQIGKISNQDDFPSTYDDMHMNFGSFARRTKIRDLDDIDMLICLSADGAFYTTHSDHLEITVPNSSKLKPYCHDESSKLNSRKVINLFVSRLKDIPQYSQSSISRNGSAAVLDLSSYDWSFDIVPCFFTLPDADGRTFYVIPDGSGHWIKTDPRIDQERITSINQYHDGKAIGLIRLLKKWNRDALADKIPSYLIECIAVNHFSSIERTDSHKGIALARCILYLHSAIQHSVSDPRHIDSDINHLSKEDRERVGLVSLQHVQVITEAVDAEAKSDHETAIEKWSSIFGTEFPPYG